MVKERGKDQERHSREEEGGGIIHIITSEREREHVCMSELERSRIQREGQDRKKKDRMY